MRIEEIAEKLLLSNRRAVSIAAGVSYHSVNKIFHGRGNTVAAGEVQKLSDYLEGKNQAAVK